MIDAAPDRISCARPSWSCSGYAPCWPLASVDAARAILETEIEVPDLREGETLGMLWQAAFGDRPLPYHYDFRMRSDSSNKLGRLALSRRFS